MPFVVGKSEKLKIDVLKYLHAISNKEFHEQDRTIAIVKCYEAENIDEKIDNLILDLCREYSYVRVAHIETECSVDDLSLLTYKITVEK